jgi:hypothetical protein
MKLNIMKMLMFFLFHLPHPVQLLSLCGSNRNKLHVLCRIGLWWYYLEYCICFLSLNKAIRYYQLCILLWRIPS